MILGIDPGNIYTAYAVLDDDCRPMAFDKVENTRLLEWIEMNRKWLPKTVYIEMIASYGMAVGVSVFDTCVWIGRFAQFLDERGFTVKYVRRKEYVTEFCGSSRAKDSNVIQYLIDRFAPDTPNRGKGNKKEPGWFYGFHADVWQAYAIGVYGNDKASEGKVSKEERGKG